MKPKLTRRLLRALEQPAELLDTVLGNLDDPDPEWDDRTGILHMLLEVRHKLLPAIDRLQDDLRAHPAEKKSLDAPDHVV